MKKINKTKANNQESKYKSVTDKLIALIEKDTLPWRKDWNCGVNSSFQNPISDSIYSGINPTLCAIDCLTYNYRSNYFASFNQAKELDWKIIKGSKATAITWAAPISTEKPNELGELEKQSFFAVRWFNVFNFDCFDDSDSTIKKTDIINKKSKTEAFINPDTRSKSIDRFIDSQKANIEHSGNQPCYLPSVDRILMPQFSDFSSRDAYYSTLLHELAHWTSHHSRLDRDLNGNKSSTSYAFEELVAELSSAYSGSYLGLSEVLLENHASYLNSWLELLKSDEKAFFKAVKFAQKATDYLIKQASLTEVKKDETLILDEQLALF
jgi:antirestriction protein ArdC